MASRFLSEGRHGVLENSMAGMEPTPINHDMSKEERSIWKLASDWSDVMYGIILDFWTGFDHGATSASSGGLVPMHDIMLDFLGLDSTEAQEVLRVKAFALLFLDEHPWIASNLN